MQSVFNLHCCSRFLPFFFLLVQCIITLNPSGKNDVDIGDGDAAQSVVSPLLLDGSNNPIAGSEDGLQEGQSWPTDDLFDTNAAPSLVIASTDQTDDPCPLPPMKEYSQRRKVRRGDSCTAPLQFKPEERTETKPKPKPGDNDGVSKAPGNRISPHSGPSFESTPSWKAPQKQPITRQNCPDPLLSNAVCASRIPDMTNWVERQYPGITVDLPECYLCMFSFPLLPSPFPLPPPPPT